MTWTNGVSVREAPECLLLARASSSSASRCRRRCRPSPPLPPNVAGATCRGPPPLVPSIPSRHSPAVVTATAQKSPSSPPRRQPRPPRRPPAWAHPPPPLLPMDPPPPPPPAPPPFRLPRHCGGAPLEGAPPCTAAGTAAAGRRFPVPPAPAFTGGGGGDTGGSGGTVGRGGGGDPRTQPLLITARSWARPLSGHLPLGWPPPPQRRLPSAGPRPPRFLLAVLLGVLVRPITTAAGNYHCRRDPPIQPATNSRHASVWSAWVRRHRSLSL